jgi:hypothetical protein
MGIACVPGWQVAAMALPFSLNPLVTPMSMTDRLHQSPDLILGALELSLSIAFLSLYLVARDFRVFRILSFFYVLLGMEQFLEYAGADPIDWTLRALAVGVIVEVAGLALKVQDWRWTRIFWPLYFLVFVGAWIPSLRGLRDLGAASEIPLGILIYQGFRRGGRVERMIAAALTLHFLVRATIFPTVSKITGQTNFMHIGGWRVRLTALTLTTLGATTLIVFSRVLMRDRIEKHRLATELEAAKAVQQVLVPEEIPEVEGLAISAVYRPFGEVGGDFFQILPIADSGALVVIGDVSGKGMQAAMMVSLLLGKLQVLVESTTSPAAILEGMNHRLQGRSGGGFTTCLVLRVDGDGLATVANAGHITPYCDGREIAVEGGLPLGLTESAKYSETTFRLERGAQLTLVTDGVVEARSSTGELLGFERTAALSVGTAEAIAGAAQAFGQDDDITVLTVRFAGSEGMLA